MGNSSSKCGTHPFSSPEPVVSWSRGRETRGRLQMNRVALGTRMGTHRIRKPPFCPATSKREASVFRNPHSGERFLGIRVDGS